MRKPGFTRSVCGALVFALALSAAGCSETEQSMITGTVLGAGLGAVIGNQKGKAAEGALIGAVVGGWIGYMVGKSRTERMASADETAKTRNYKAVQGLQADVTAAYVKPQIANPGDDVDLNTTVDLLAPDPGQEIKVRQRIGIYKGNELVGNIVEDEFMMTPGTHRMTRRITLQKNFPAGKYTYVTHIRAFAGEDVTEDQTEASFTVS